MKKKITILGSTGSIGMNTLAVVDHFPDDFEIIGLTAGNNIELLSRQIKRYNPRMVAVLNSDKIGKLKALVSSLNTKILGGLDGLKEIARDTESDIVVAALSGSGGLIPILEAIKKGKTVALANKEPMVMAGDLVLEEVKKSGAIIIPIDSEHNAIFQCLDGRDKDEVESITLTCSGGPFYRWSSRSLSRVTPSRALRHPRWKMGKKITIDSSTLMNKGLEIIEATYLFGVELSRIKVVIHPEAIVHALVELRDGMVLGLLGETDMRLPIQHALYYPERKKNTFPKLDIVNIGALHFYAPDEKKFPCLALAKHARKIGGTMTTVLNGANEVAVEAFLRQDIKFLEIPNIIEEVMNRHRVISRPGLEEILSQDRWAKEEAERLIYG